MPALAPSSSSRSAAALALTGCLAALNAAAGPAPETDADAPAGEALPSPTSFTVLNRLHGTLHGFRIRSGHGHWAEIGELPPGESRFTVAAPSKAGLGSFEFLRDAWPGDADYLLGAYARGEDGTVLIELSGQPGSVDGRAQPAAQGSFTLEPARASATVASRLAPDPRLPLVEVPAELAGLSEFMVCGGIGPGLSFLGCRSGSLSFSSLGHGLNLGLTLGYFWSPLTPQALAQPFPVTLYTFQPLVGAYFQFLAQLGPDSPLENIGQFVGLGPSIGAALNWGSFQSSGKLRQSPMGSYRASCSHIAYDPGSQELSAQCQSSSGAPVRASLSAASCFGGDVANDDGTLRCELPAGSYQRSCAPLRYRGGVLQALCTRSGTATQLRSSLDVAQACAAGSGISNVDGRLRCDQPWLPSGPYRGGCRDLRYADGVLQARCGSLDTGAADLRLAYAEQCRPGSDVGFSPEYARPGRLYCVEPLGSGT